MGVTKQGEIKLELAFHVKLYPEEFTQFCTKSLWSIQDYKEKDKEGKLLTERMVP